MGLVVVDVDALQLEVALALVGTVRLDAMLVGDDLPELGTDLVSALTSLDVDDFTKIDVLNPVIEIPFSPHG